MDGGAWWAAVHGVAKSWTQLSDFTFSFHFPLSCIGEGNGNPLQCSCLENPRDGGAWWAAVYGVAQSWTRLKRFSSSSSSIPLFQPTRNLNRVKNPSTQQPPQLPPFKVPLAIVYESFAFEFVLTELFFCKNTVHFLGVSCIFTFFQSPGAQIEKEGILRKREGTLI